MLIDEETRQFQPDHSAALIPITLPSAIQRALIVFDRSRFIVLSHGKSRELEIDNAVARLGFEKCIEVGNRLVGATGSGERHRQFYLGFTLFRIVFKSGAEGINCLVRMSVGDRGFAPFEPAIGQYLSASRERIEEEVCGNCQSRSDQEQAQQCYEIPQDQLSFVLAFCGSEWGSQLKYSHLYYLKLLM